MTINLSTSSFPGLAVGNIYTDKKQGSDGIGETDFSDALNESGTENGVAEKWTSVGLYTMVMGSPNGYTVNADAIARVKEALKAEGIDADGRIPTHDVTDEQIELLRSRYDFERLANCGFTDAEYGNFILDLAYMNIFSFDDVENMFGVVPFYSEYQVIGVYSRDYGGFSDPLGSEEIIDEDELNVRNIVLHLKATDPGRTDGEYMSMARDIYSKRCSRVEIIKFILSGNTAKPEQNTNKLPTETADNSGDKNDDINDFENKPAEKRTQAEMTNDIFAQFADRMLNTLNSGYPNIDNALEKLKEEFGISY